MGDQEFVPQRRAVDSQYEALVIATLALKEATIAFNYHQQMCDERESNTQKFFDKADKRFNKIEKLVFAIVLGTGYSVLDILEVAPF